MTVPLTARVDHPDARWRREATPRGPFTSVVHVNEKGGRFGGTEEYIALLTAGLSARGVRRFLELVAADLRLDATAIQTVGAKGWDGFVLAVVGAEPGG